MKLIRNLKIRTQITLFTIFILLEILLFTLLFFTLFRNFIEKQNLQYFQSTFQDVSRNMNGTLAAIQQKLAGLDGDAALQKYCFSENTWDSYIYGLTIRNDLTNSVSTLDALEAIAIDLKINDSILSSNEMDAADFAFLLDDALLHERERYQFPILITGPSGGNYFVFCQGLSAYHLSYKQMQPVGKAYAFVRLDALLPLPAAEQFSLLLHRDKNVQILAPSDPEFSECLLTPGLLPLTGQDIQHLTIQNVHYLCGVSSFTNGLEYVMLQTTASIENSNRLLFLISCLFLSPLLLFCIWALLNINRRIAYPMRRIDEELSRISGGDLDYRLTHTRRDEFGQIAFSVNQLLDDLAERNRDNILAREQLYHLEILKKDSELMALRYQINPHFLYNSLECVRSIASCYQADAVHEIVTELIGIFRYCTTGDNYATIREEVLCCRHYSEIIRIRFDGKYTFRFSIQEQTLDCRIPKMTLQPIVENAIYHGLERQRSSGSVDISTFLEDSHVVLRIHDTGAGMSAAQLDTLRKKLRELPDSHASSHGIGLANVYQRIIHEYGAGGGLQIDSAAGEYTTVTLRIPRRQA